MFYVFTCTPGTGPNPIYPNDFPLRLTPGIIHQVDVLFQDECDHAEYIQIFDDLRQLWPTNRGESMRGNATVISFREFYEITPGNNILTAKVATALTGDDIKEIIVQIGVLPKRIIQPMSFDQLLEAAAGM